jgi:hypothetical protein
MNKKVKESKLVEKKKEIRLWRLYRLLTSAVEDNRMDLSKDGYVDIIDALEDVIMEEEKK